MCKCQTKSKNSEYAHKKNVKIKNIITKDYVCTEIVNWDSITRKCEITYWDLKYEKVIDGLSIYE